MKPPRAGRRAGGSTPPAGGCVGAAPALPATGALCYKRLRHYRDEGRPRSGPPRGAAGGPGAGVVHRMQDVGLVAIGRNRKGDIFFYDTGGDIIQDLGALEYIKERIVRDYFGESDE